MSRDVSPEICGWCGVEEPCGCPDRVDLLVHLDPAHDGPEDLGGFDDMDGDESDDRGTAACPDHCRGECGDPTCPYVVAWERKDGAPDPLCAECSRLRIEAGRMDARLTAAREAIRVLLGDAGLDGLGDLTTADGRSVVDIVRRGMGAGT